MFEKIIKGVKNYLKSRKHKLWDKEKLFSFPKKSFFDKIPFTKVAIGMIEIIHENGSHSGNALLLNKNGLFLTCYHCVENNLSELKIRKQDGSIYEIQKIIYFDKKRDIAICRSRMNRRSQKIKYKIFELPKENFDKEVKIPVTLFSLYRGNLNTRKGTSELLVKIANVPEKFKNRFLEVNVRCICGDSGGVVIDSTGSIIGFLSSGNTEKITGYVVPWKLVDKIIKKLS